MGYRGMGYGLQGVWAMGHISNGGIEAMGYRVYVQHFFPIMSLWKNPGGTAFSSMLKSSSLGSFGKVVWLHFRQFVQGQQACHPRSTVP